MLKSLASYGNQLDALAGVHKKVDASWWLSGGILSANCIAAYQPKGATDYATSKINLANIGVYTITEVAGNSGFDTAIGWIGVTNNVLSTGITLGSGYSVIARYEIPGASGGYGSVYGYNTNPLGNSFSINPLWQDTKKQLWGAYKTIGDVNEGIGDHTVAHAGSKGYFDGVSKLTNATAPTGTLYIFALNAITSYRIKALAVYDTALSDAQVLAVSDAIKTL